MAGEHCDGDSLSWAQNVFQVRSLTSIQANLITMDIILPSHFFPPKAPILNHWWQTETGHAITASCIGLEHSLSPPRYSAAGMPFPGYNGNFFIFNDFKFLKMRRIFQQ